VQYQLLHVTAYHLPSVYYEQIARALMDEARHQQLLDRSWQALNPEQQADYTQQAAQRPRMTRPVRASARPAALTPLTGFAGSLRHPRFGAWLVQELVQPPLPEIEPYPTLTWILVTPDEPRRTGEFRRAFTLEDVPHLLDMLDSDWRYLLSGGRPQLTRARQWFAPAPVEPNG
jgi:integrase